MGDVVVPAAPSIAEHSGSVERAVSRTLHGALPFAALTCLVFLIHGYHPYSQDATIYIAGAEKDLDRSLFSPDMGFVESHARLSVFSHSMAAVSRYLHIPLDVVILLAYIASIALFLMACHRLAVRLFDSQREQWGATLLPAACFTIPVAATALLLMDPYVTARSFSTPLSIFAVTSCLDHSWKGTVLWTILVIALHPQMGALLVCFLLVLGLVEARRGLQALGLCLGGFLICGVITWFAKSSVVTQAYREVVETRSYFFLSEWRWYEVIGLIAPVVLMGITVSRCKLDSKMGRLAGACVLVGTTAFLCALCFVHPGHPDIIMRAQPLRSFHVIYCVGAVMLGGFLVSYFREHSIWIGIACFAVAFVAMAAADNESYLQSQRIELPWVAVTNPWEQAFFWIRANTPKNAVFAADPTAFTQRDEDVQGFRVIAERSILNGAKDDGVALLFPDLAPIWLQRRRAEQGLDEMSDSERIARLHAYGVTWVLLSPTAATDFPCPYQNEVLKVCRMG